MFVDFRARGSTLEARAKKFGFLMRDRNAIKPALVFDSRGRLAAVCSRAAFGEKHAVPAGAGIETMMRRVEVVQDISERIPQLCAFLSFERGNCVQHMI